MTGVKVQVVKQRALLSRVVSMQVASCQIFSARGFPKVISMLLAVNTCVGSTHRTYNDGDTFSEINTSFEYLISEYA